MSDHRRDNNKAVVMVGKCPVLEADLALTTRAID